MSVPAPVAQNPALAALVSVPLPRASWGRFVTLPNVLTLAYFIIAAVLVTRHDIWRDEAQAFLLARDSASIPELYRHLRYEGHPGLWHILLWLMTRITARPEAMQWLHLAMATASIYLVARFSPFIWLEKILFAFGYFTLFEYCVIARNYQIALLLTLIFCVVWTRKRGGFVWHGIVLGLLCHTNICGTIMAGALGIMILCESAFTRTGWTEVRKHWIQFLAGIVILAGMAWLVVYYLQPAPDLGFSPSWEIGVDRRHVIKSFPMALRRSLRDQDHVNDSLASLWNGYVPLRKFGADADPHMFWWSNEVDDGSVAAKWGLVICGAALLCVVRRPWVAVAFVIGTEGMLIFFHARFAGWVRHHGNYFVLLVACLWLTWARNKPLTAWWKRIPRILAHAFFVALLGVHVFAAGTAVYLSWSTPFSVGHEAANFIRSQLRPGDRLVAQFAPPIATLAAYLPGEKFFMPTLKWGTYTVWDHHGEEMGDIEDAVMYAKGWHCSVLVIQISPVEYLPRGVKLLKAFRGGLVIVEDYYIYRIEKPPEPAPHAHDGAAGLSAVARVRTGSYNPVDDG